MHYCAFVPCAIYVYEMISKVEIREKSLKLIPIIIVLAVSAIAIWNYGETVKLMEYDQKSSSFHNSYESLIRCSSTLTISVHHGP